MIQLAIDAFNLQPRASPTMAEAQPTDTALALLSPRKGDSQNVSAEDASEVDSGTVDGSAAASSNQKSSGDGAEKTSSTDERAEGDSGVIHLSSLLSRGESDLDVEVNRLKVIRAQMKADKKLVNTELRNTEPKRSRLRARAKLLSTQDLLEVYAMRVRANAIRDARPQPAEPQETAPTDPVSGA